ncbi:MAG: hypothetical protein ACTSWC_12865 [Promethearchaeota archaeon]
MNFNTEPGNQSDNQTNKQQKNQSNKNADSWLPLHSQVTISAKNVQIKVAIYSLHNGFLLLVSDQPSFGLGTLSISIPPSSISEKSIGTPISEFGLKYTTLTNIIGKRASKTLGKPVLTIVSLQDQEIPLKEFQKLVLQAVAEALETQPKH